MFLSLNFRGFQIEIKGELLKEFPVDSEFRRYVQSTYGKTLDNLVDPADQVSRTTVYLNRNGFLFHSILDYLETGHLHFSHDVCSGVILNELQFWGYGPINLSPCCLDRVLKDQHDSVLVQNLSKQWNSVSEIQTTVHPARGMQITGLNPADQGYVEPGGVTTPLPAGTKDSKLRDIIMNPASCILAKVKTNDF